MENVISALENVFLLYKLFYRQFVKKMNKIDRMVCVSKYISQKI